MKKLLFVILMIIIVSFLFVGCLPVTPSEGDGEGESEGEAEVIIEIEKEYKSPAGVTYVPCKAKVTVTFPTPVDTDYVVYIARKIVDGDGNVEYRPIEPEPIPATPNADRTVWIIEEYAFLYGYPCSDLDKDVQVQYCSCEPICLIALVKHPCCPGEEVALRVVTVDCQSPILDLFVKFNDCIDSCEEPNPCNPSTPGVYMEWTSNNIGSCESTSCCDDDCSGVASWSIEINPDSCGGPCTLVTGEGCPVEGAVDCGCLTYADAGTTVVHTIIFTIVDNVGNKDTSTWELTFTSDKLSTFEFVNYGVIPEIEGNYQVYGECTNRCD